MTLAKRVSAVVLFAAFAGCKNDLPKSTEIVHMRVLGSKLEVVGDETRSSPKPGETVTVSMVTVFPSLKQTTANVKSLFIGCTAPTRFTGGLPICQEFLDSADGGSGSGGGVGAALPIATGKFHCDDFNHLPVPVPVMEVAGRSTQSVELAGVSIQCILGDPVALLKVARDFKASQKLLLGVVCERGDAFIDPSDPLLFGCDHDSGETLRINESIRVQQHASDENHNPSGEDVGIGLESRPNDTWGPINPDLMPMEDNCRPSNDGVPQKNPQDDAGVPAETAPTKNALPQVDYLSHTMTLSYTAAAREKINGVPEELELSVFATGGTLERRFTLFGAGDKVVKGQFESDLTWDPPPVDELPKNGKGKLIRFFVTVRDQRGGFDMTSRAVCIKLGKP